MKFAQSIVVIIAFAAVASLTVAVRAGVVSGAVSFLVNTNTEGSQRAPSADFGSDGSALVAWDSDAEGSPRIVGRLIGPDGLPLGEEFPLSPTADRSQIRPAVAGLPGGGFVVAYESYDFDSDDDEIRVQRVSSDGELVGENILIKESELHLHVDVAVAAGGFVVVWDDGFDIIGKRFSASGESVGDTFFVNSEIGTMYGPRIASAGGGIFAVVWDDRSELDGDGEGIFLRRFDAEGNPIGGDLQVNSTAEGDQYGASIAMRADGNFVVAWEAYGQQSTGDGAFAQLFAADGTRVGGEFRVDGGDSVYAGFLDAASLADGFIVSWNEPRDDGSDTLNTFARRVDLQGNRGEVIDIDSQGGGDQANARLATDGDNLLVVWEGFGLEDHDIYAQRYSVLELTECPGDCDNDGTVSISELIRAVNIALGLANVATCPAVDRDGSGTVAINELIAAVNSALFGC